MDYPLNAQGNLPSDWAGGESIRDENCIKAVEAMAREVVNNSAIEGVSLDLESVRASMMLRLGVATNLAQASGSLRRVDPVVNILAEAAEGSPGP